MRTFRARRWWHPAGTKLAALLTALVALAWSSPLGFPVRYELVELAHVGVCLALGTPVRLLL